MWTLRRFFSSLRYHQAKQKADICNVQVIAQTRTSLPHASHLISSLFVQKWHISNNSAVLHFCITHVVMITLCWSSQMSTIKRLWTDTRLKQNTVLGPYFDATPRVLPGSKSYWNKNIAPYVTSKIQIAHDGIRHVIRFTVQVHNRHIQFCMLNGQCGALREPLQN